MKDDVRILIDPAVTGVFGGNAVIAFRQRRERLRDCNLPSACAAREPSSRGHVRLQKVQQQGRDFSAGGVGRMGAVLVGQILAFVGQPVDLAGSFAVGPEILRSPWVGIH